MSTRPVPVDGRPPARPRLLIIANMWPGESNPMFGIFVERHVRALQEAGAQVTVVANSDARTGARALIVKYASLTLRALVAARRGRFDAVVGHYLYPTAALAAATAGRARVPFVLVAHGTDAASVLRGGYIARRCRAALDAAALVVTVSHALQRVVCDDLGLGTRTRTAVVNMGVDDTVFRPDPDARQRLGIAPAERVVLFAGNLTHGKGVDTLLEALLPGLGTGAVDRLVLVGHGPLEPELRSRIEHAASADAGEDLVSRIEFTGRLAALELARWMAAADVFVLPSRAEGLGLVTLEAMACGTPCVGTAVGGIPEAVEVPGCGRLVAPDDPAMLAGAVAEVLSLGKDSFVEACLAQAARHTCTVKAAEMLEEIEKVGSYADGR